MAASASYWNNAPDSSEYAWRCGACRALGVEPTEAKVVRAMNKHMRDDHPDSGYVAPPIPR